MKSLVTLVLLFVTVFGEDKPSSFLHSYENQDYTDACRIGRELFYDKVKDERLLIAIGHACAEDDYIDFIGVLQQRLGNTAESRRTSVYLTTLLLEKRLLSQFMYEGTDISPYVLPKTDHILSLVFDAIKNKRYTIVSDSPKTIRVGDDTNYIDVMAKEKILMYVYQNKKLIQQHRYRR